ncbi:tyrosine-type recombinase/integrase [Propionivibrio sp.]|uniref:tyrosine-type recombinase/integrase n=1 Tax=Propionivibrio sp. TaxID=2212460 RepID=UPI003BF1DA02
MSSDNPFLTLNQLRDSWYKVQPRSRIVGQNEGDLKKWWSAVEALRPDIELKARDILADYLQLSLLWGGRRGEILSLEWKDVSLQDETICFVETKNGIEHIFPMTRYVRQLLEKRKRINESNDQPSLFVFPSPRANKAGVRSHLVEPKRAIADVKKGSGCDFSSHDLRRTFGTLFNETGVSDYTVKRALNHAAHDTASRHYLQSRIAPLRSLYQAYETKVLVEAGVISEPEPEISVGAADYANFLEWKSAQSQSTVPD